MSVYKDMAHDAGYRGEEAEQLAQAIEQDHMRQAMEHQEQEPDQIDMMSVDELRTALRSASSEGNALKRQDEVHMKTRRALLRQIEAWKWKLRDTREHLTAVVDGYFNDSGAEPSVSVHGRAADEAKKFLAATRTDTVSEGQSHQITLHPDCQKAWDRGLTDYPKEEHARDCEQCQQYEFDNMRRG